ncbi:MAG: hypothetical protein ABIL89_04995 [candidate division WOR-3 bacterium]
MRNLTLIATILIGVAYATETRIQVLTQNALRDGYANFLLDDEFIIQFYPSALFKFPAHATLEMPNIPRNTLFGDYAYASAFGKYSNFGYGAYLGRSRVNLDYNFDGNSELQITPLDLVGGINLENMALGLNLILGVYSDDDEQNPATTNNANVIGFNPSLSFYPDEKSGINIGIPVRFVSAKNKTGSTVNVEYSGSSFGFRGRYYNGPIIVFASFTTGSISSDNPATPDNPDIKSSITSFGAGAGLNLPISDIGFGIIGLTANSQSTTFRVGTSEQKGSDFFIGFLVGGEAKVLRDNFKVRSSFTYDFLRSADQNGKFNTIGNAGNLTLGFGYEVGFIRFDAAVSTELLYNGPFFLTGNQSGFIPAISLIAKF